MARRLLARRLASALLATSAAVAVPTIASAQDWTGIYYGLNFGAGSSDLRWSNLVVPSAPDSGLPGQVVINPSSGGVQGGAQLGYNQQMGMWVWGVEAAFDASDFNGSATCFGGYGDYHATCGSRTSWKLDFTARVGGTVGPAFIYIKGGGVLADELTSAKHISECFDGCSDVGSFKTSDSTPVGYLLGAGVEFALTDSMSAALEYNYTSLDFTAHMKPTPALAGGPSSFLATPFNVDVTHQQSVVTARLNFKLD